jgi:serine/threonine-protein kinase RsbT
MTTFAIVVSPPSRAVPRSGPDSQFLQAHTGNALAQLARDYTKQTSVARDHLRAPSELLLTCVVATLKAFFSVSLHSRLSMTSSGTTDFERLAKVLERHISPMNARSVLRQSLSEHKLSSNQFTFGDLRVINGTLERGLRLFTTDAVLQRALREIGALPRTSSLAPQVEPTTIEPDISRARSAARSMCEHLGAKGFSLQKVTTIVSELARNIQSYAGQGKIELSVKTGSKPRVVIRATDRGPGIPNLPLIMSGEYRSRTGLGRGILGTKRLADHFEINTGSFGTQILAEVEL